MTRLTDLGGDAAEPGTVYLVGGGPGDPGLLTVRAATLLASATVVAHDRLSPPEALALCRPDAEVLYVGKMPDRHALAQEQINELLVDRAHEGHAVVRFKGGDPFVFGRGSEEALACAAAGVPFEVVPGISSAIAAPAYGGVPVTHRGTSPAFAVVTGHEDPTKPESQVDYQALAAFPGTLIFLMGVGRIAGIAEALVAAGRPVDTPVSTIRWGTTPRQEQLQGTLADIAGQVERNGFGPPAVTVVGEVAGLAGQLRWFDTRPLHGRSVLVPRTRHQASELSRRLRALGAAVVEAPTIAIEPPPDPQMLVDRMRRLADGRYSWVAFTSANAVDAAAEAVAAAGGDSRWFARTRIAAVGSGTVRALSGLGLTADLVPSTFTTRGLGEALADAAVGANAPVLLPRADIASDTLSDVLTTAGVAVDEVDAYRTVPAEALDDDVRTRLVDGGYDAIAVGSSSTVRNLVGLLGRLPHPDIAVVSVGPVTSRTCRELGLGVTAEADPHDMDGLAQAVVTALA